ncbi:MAG: hypothetical protein RLZZ403_906 [Pseudomonadota bacterium]
MKSGDTATVTDMIDWDPLRNAVKQELRTLLQRLVNQEASSTEDQTMIAFVGGIGSAISDAVLDELFTKENVVALMTGDTPDFSGLGFLGDAVAGGIQTAFQNEGDTSINLDGWIPERISYTLGYASFGVFEVRIFIKIDAQPLPLPVGRIVLTRSGLGWMVTGVRFGEDVIELLNHAQNANETQDVASKESNESAAGPTDEISSTRKDQISLLSSAETSQSYEQIALNEAIAGLELQGYSNASELIIGSLSTGGTQEHQLSLEDGSYVVTARCDNNCSDLDLEIVNEYGVTVGSDATPNDFPTVRFDVTQSATDIVKIVMASCSVDPCAYTFAVLRTN